MLLPLPGSKKFRVLTFQCGGPRTPESLSLRVPTDTSRAETVPTCPAGRHTLPTLLRSSAIHRARWGPLSLQCSSAVVDRSASLQEMHARHSNGGVRSGAFPPLTLIRHLSILANIERSERIMGLGARICRQRIRRNLLTDVQYFRRKLLLLCTIGAKDTARPQVPAEARNCLLLGRIEAFCTW